MQAGHPKTDGEMDAAGDLLLGLIVSAFALFVLVESIRMPQRGHLGFVCYPGFVPFLTGMALILLSMLINLRALRKGGHRHVGRLLRAVTHNEEGRRFLCILGFMVLYIVGLLGRVPFVAATFVFHLLTFIYLKIGGYLKIGFYSILATFLVAMLLPWFFEMPIP